MHIRTIAFTSTPTTSKQPSNQPAIEKYHFFFFLETKTFDEIERKKQIMYFMDNYYDDSNGTFLNAFERIASHIIKNTMCHCIL